MMPSALTINVRLHDSRYHGDGDWPPCPARLFQALVAGAGLSGQIEEVTDSLRWLEKLPPPLIGAPPARRGQRVMCYMPNNNMDAVSGDPRRIARIRTAKKFFAPYLFDAEIPFLYIWQDLSDEDADHTSVICSLADHLYQLGRGIDMAWAWAEALNAPQVEVLLASYPGHIQRPAPGVGGNGENTLLCAHPGSLESIRTRYQAYRRRFKVERNGKLTFQQAPRPNFRPVTYDSQPERQLYELRNLSKDSRFHPWSLTDTARLVMMVRDTAAKRLKAALPNDSICIDHIFGRVKDLSEADKAERIRIIPLPSIGHPHAEASIRRILIEIPPNCRLRHDDLAWAFSGLYLGSDPETGEIQDETLPMLVEANDQRMASHFGVDSHYGRSFRLWRTVTPAALPERTARRRIDPARIHEEAKGATERLAEEAKAAAAVRHALRHAGVETPVEAIRVQREPFRATGARAEEFARETRFSKHRLWHVEIAFTEPRTGPLVIGDGRYLGLGLMAPEQDVFLRAAVFIIWDSAPHLAARADVLKALRRALMALDRDLDDNGRISTLFSGHKPHGAPAGDGTHNHVFLAADVDESGKTLDRLYVILPDVVDRRAKLGSCDARRFKRVVTALKTVRIGRLEVLKLKFVGDPMPDDRLFATARVWNSLTDYRPTRHPKRKEDEIDLLKRDAITECRRRGLPIPKVRVLSHNIGPRGGLRARLRLEFAVAVTGPLLLGPGAHKGEGVFGA